VTLRKSGRSILHSHSFDIVVSHYVPSISMVITVNRIQSHI